MAGSLIYSFCLAWFCVMIGYGYVVILPTYFPTNVSGIYVARGEAIMVIGGLFFGFSLLFAIIKKVKEDIDPKITRIVEVAATILLTASVTYLSILRI